MPTALTPAAGFWGIRDFCPALAGSAPHTTLGHCWKEACRAGGAAVAAPLRCKNCLVLHCHIFRPCPGVCLLLPVGCSSTCPVFGVLRLHPSAAGAMLAPSPHASPAETQALMGLLGFGAVCVCATWRRPDKDRLSGWGRAPRGAREHLRVPHRGAGPRRSPHTPLPPVPPLPTWRPPHPPPIPSPARHTQDGSSQRSDPAPHAPSSD